MDCSTIIVSYNTFDLTRDAVASALDAAPGLESEIIVVDNNSPDRSAERLRSAFPTEEYPSVHIVSNETNRGFAAANNIGAERARGDTLFFLNPDTVVHGTAIGILHDFVQQHGDAGAVGPRVENEDGTVQKSTSAKVTPAALVAHHLPVTTVLRGQQQQDAAPETTTTVDVVKGCALCVARSVFERVGGWDESYFMYAEERELCYAIQEAGFTNYYCPAARITHYGGASTLENYAEQQIVHHRSVVQFLKRHHSPFMRVIHRVTGAIGFGIRALVFPVLATASSESNNNYRRRGEAARNLFRWFIWDYSSDDSNR